MGAGPRLSELRRQGLERTARSRLTPAGRIVDFGGRPLLHFCSNDYLALASHPEVLHAAREGIRRWGWGSAAARLVTGSTRAHADLEEALAAFHGRPAALLFGSGWQANVGAIPALMGKGDLVLSDERNHASLIDGCRLSGAEIRVFRHADLGHLGSLLRRKRGRGSCWIVTDAVFSVEGDLAPLAGILELARRHGASTYVDEAHAVGVYGPGGRGLAAGADVAVGTLSKALGGIGGWVSGPEDLVRVLRSTARSFLFTTAAPPAAAEAGLAALGICRSAEGDERRKRLWSHVRALGAGGPILAIPCAGVADAPRVSKGLESQGICVSALRPPTVPSGTSALRITLSAAHTAADVRKLKGALHVHRAR